MNSKEYEAAIVAHNAAIAAYNPIRQAYRNGLIGDKEFIAAQNTYHDASELFDKAFTKEQAA